MKRRFPLQNVYAYIIMDSIDYNDVTTTSIELVVNRGTYLKIALSQVHYLKLQPDKWAFPLQFL